MASKYIQKFPVPEGFPEILHDLAKEILRNQPADILDFSALYFKCLQEGTVLDYANRGQNTPCDFKTGVPVVSERPQRKKPLNERDEALHAAALENSANIAKKPMTPDAKLIQADSGNAHGSSNQAAENLVSELKGEAAEIKSGIERRNTENSAVTGSQKGGKNKTEENFTDAVGNRNMSSAKASRKSERPESKNSGNNTKEMVEISEKFLEDVLQKKSQEVRVLDEHINANKENPNEQMESTKLAEAPGEEQHEPKQAAENSEAQASPEEEPKAEAGAEAEIEAEAKAEAEAEAESVKNENADA